MQLIFVFSNFFSFFYFTTFKKWFFSKSSFFCQKKFEAKNESGIRGFFPSMQIQSPAESSARVSRTKSDAGNFFSVSFWAQASFGSNCLLSLGNFRRQGRLNLSREGNPLFSHHPRERETNKKFKNKNSFPQHVTS